MRPERARADGANVIASAAHRVAHARRRCQATEIAWPDEVALREAVRVCLTAKMDTDTVAACRASDEKG